MAALHRLLLYCVFPAVLLVGPGCAVAQPSNWLEEPAIAPVVRPVIVGAIPHDSTAYTQGLFFADGQLVESTGGYGTSTVRVISPRTGSAEIRLHLPARYFGEGAARLGDRIYHLTWRERTGFIYDVSTLAQVGTFQYSGEGWGLTTDGASLILSDGSDVLRFLDPTTFATTRTLAVFDGRRPVRQLNELEWIEGELWANVLLEDRIAVIDPASGVVSRWIDLQPAVPARRRYDPAAVSNGIAYDAATRRVYVTGKLWPHIQILELQPAAAR